MEKITSSNHQIRQIKTASEVDSEVMKSLFQLLKDAVAKNYSVGFMKDSTEADFENFGLMKFHCANRKMDYLLLR